MKTFLKRSILPALGATAAMIITYTAPAAAATFNQNEIMSDAVFDNVGSLNAGQIDAFLNTFPNSCISTNNGFAASDPTGYSPSPSQFFYSTTPVSAGKVIYDAAQAYGINPQVLLATLQKEEGLVDGSGPYGCSPTSMASAVGYGCTDSGTNTHDYTYPNGGLVTPLYYSNGTPSNSVAGSCVNSGPKAGFSEQLIHAAWLLRFGEQRSEGNINWAVVKGSWDNSDDPQSCYSGPMTEGTWQRCPSGGSAFYDGYTTIDNIAVHMDNGATAALYWYTPHFPGNQNFFNIFTQWFGATTILPEVQSRYAYLSSNGAPLGTPTDDGFCTDTVHTACWQGFQNGYLVYSKDTGAWESYGPLRSRWGQLGYQNGLMGFPSGPIYCTLADSGCYQQYQNGFIVGSPTSGWWESMGSIRARWAVLNFETGKMGYPTGPIASITNGGYYQQYQNGYIVGNNSAGYWESMNGPVRDRWGALKFQDGRLGYPTSAPDCTTQPSSGCAQHFQGGIIYWTSATGAWQVWGGIGGRYSLLNADSSNLGYPVNAEVCGAIKNNGCFQQYQNGYIVGSSATGWWESLGPIRDRWGALSYQDGSLGYPIDGQDCSQPGSGCKQDFQGGTVYWTSATGAWQTWGGIGGRYTQLGTDSSNLGYPVNAEVCGAIKNNGCFQLYQNGYIVGTSTTGWWESLGGIRTRWGQLGYENGELGYPTGGQACNISNSGCFQRYQYGFIVGNPTTGYWESFGTIRDKWASLGYQDSSLGYPTGAVVCTSGTCSQTYEHGTIFANQSTTWYTQG